MIGRTSQNGEPRSAGFGCRDGGQALANRTKYVSVQQKQGAKALLPMSECFN